MSAYELSDEQYLVLDLLMRARQKGVLALNRVEVLESPSLPSGAKIRLVWAALTMPKGLLTWLDHHNFAITDEGVAVYNLRFGTASGAPEPSMIADAVICLPGPEHYRT